MKTLNPEDILTRAQVAELLKISYPTLSSWTKLGYLKAYRIGKRNVYYLYQEVMEAFREIK